MIWFTSDTHFGHENVLKIDGHSPVSLDELREWFAGVDEPCDRVKWPWWVNETGDRQVERELAAYKRKEQS